MKEFNVCGTCFPDKHYMVDLTERCRSIKEMVDKGYYFCINRGRQFGKTTTLEALHHLLGKDYAVFSLSFEQMGTNSYASVETLAYSFLKKLYIEIQYSSAVLFNREQTELLRKAIDDNATGKAIEIDDFCLLIRQICNLEDKRIIVMIDEVDQAGNHESFLRFLGLLRNMYLERENKPTFQSVILASVYNIKNLKTRIRPENASNRYNSPWNIAAQFNIEMAFNTADVAGMLREYETDCHTGMNIGEMSQLLIDYTGGYPFLVSRLCKMMDTELRGHGIQTLSDCWTEKGLRLAVNLLLKERNTLFDELDRKVEQHDSLKKLLRKILLNGERVPYVNADYGQSLALMFDFIREEDGRIVVNNRIFETYLYNFFLYEEQNTVPELNSSANYERNIFVKDGKLNMNLILERFQVHYADLFADKQPKWYEDDARKCFLIFLKPIINGTGHYYVEAETRDEQRMDVVVNYNNEEFIIELKVWRGQAYNQAGVEQLCGYLDSMHADRGWLVTFNFNKNKIPGITTSVKDGKTITELVL